MTGAISGSRNPRHHVLAGRSLVRAHLQQSNKAIDYVNKAIDDAEEVFVAWLSHTLILTSSYTKSIAAQPSLLGFIAKSVSLVGKGKRHEAYRACDIAFEHSSHVSFLLLIKVCVYPLH